MRDKDDLTQPIGAPAHPAADSTTPPTEDECMAPTDGAATKAAPVAGRRGLAARVGIRRDSEGRSGGFGGPGRHGQPMPGGGWGSGELPGRQAPGEMPDDQGSGGSVEGQESGPRT